MAKKTFQRVDGKTPKGGDYAILYFQNEDGEACEKAKATRVEIVEFSSEGEALARSYGMCH